MDYGDGDDPGEWETGDLGVKEVISGVDSLSN